MFQQAGSGISGANFAVADTGSVVMVENEGNIRLSTTAPRVHIALVGIEKLIPRSSGSGRISEAPGAHRHRPEA